MLWYLKKIIVIIIVSIKYYYEDQWFVYQKMPDIYIHIKLIINYQIQLMVLNNSEKHVYHWHLEKCLNKIKKIDIQKNWIIINININVYYYYYKYIQMDNQ